MSGLLGPDGKPISSVQFKKDPPPKLGEAFAPWAGRDVEFMQLPGGSLVQFDLSKLRLEDYRIMRDHYQVNASLAVLSFIQHQAEWRIECEDKKIADSSEEQLREIWTPLNRALGTANWAGYSPNAFDWENNVQKGRVEITKIKDLYPEECTVHWDEVEGWAPPGRPRPKYKIYGGINYAPQKGWPIPVENSFWYPLLMENGDYYGRKLLRPAFQSWFFSILLHLFANRYFERFGEPTPVGRAPFDEQVTVDGQTLNGNQYLLKVIQQLRNRSAVVLPNDRTQTGNNGQTEFDYELEYLESQMRGADFERYLTRLDEEISLGLFTPILLLRTADVGSYNLGTGHMQVYQWMLNAMNADRALYINKYILRKYTNYNFSPNAPSPKIVFRKMGNTDNELIRQLLVELVKSGKTTVDLEELGELAGLSLKQVRQTLKQSQPSEESDASSDSNQNDGTENLVETKATVGEIVARVRQQVETGFRQHKFNSSMRINMGFKRRFERALIADGLSNAGILTDNFYGRMDNWLSDVVALGESEFSGPDTFMSLFERVVNIEIRDLVR